MWVHFDFQFYLVYWKVGWAYLPNGNGLGKVGTSVGHTCPTTQTKTLAEHTFVLLSV